MLTHPQGYIYNPPKPSFEKEGFEVTSSATRKIQNEEFNLLAKLLVLSC
jgi:hypothetical protein